MKKLFAIQYYAFQPINSTDPVALSLMSEEYRAVYRSVLTILLVQTNQTKNY